MPGGRRPNSRSERGSRRRRASVIFYNKVRDGLIELANEYVLLEAVRGRRRKPVKAVSKSVARSPRIPGPDRAAGQSRRPRLRAG